MSEDYFCKHGTAMDMHCCNCHSGFLFDTNACVCEREVKDESIIEVRRRYLNDAAFNRAVDVAAHRATSERHQDIAINAILRYVAQARINSEPKELWRQFCLDHPLAANWVIQTTIDSVRDRDLKERDAKPIDTFLYSGTYVTPEAFLRTELPNDIGHRLQDGGEMLRAYCTAAANVVARIVKQRDKWLDAFNRSEQFQNGPTTHAEKAEAKISALATFLDSPEFYELMQTYRHTPLADVQATHDAFVAVKAAIHKETS